MLNSISLIKSKCPQFNRTMSTQILRDIFLKSVESVQPQRLIKNQVKWLDGHLSIKDQTFPLHKPCYVVGFGKAVYGMALALEEILADHLQMGLVIIPEGILCTEFENTRQGSKLRFIEGAKNNIPDENAMVGASEMKKLIEHLTGDDLVLVLISGGGSALLPLPVPPITLGEKQDLIKELSTKGADILELNCVRKQISLLKGGGLAELAYPARVVSLILSDIVGDPLDFIASGPTTPNRDKVEDAIEIIRKYHCWKSLPESVKQVLTKKNHHSVNKSVPIIKGKYQHVENFIIGNNEIAANAAKQHALSLGFQSAIISTSLTGNVMKISQIYADLARNTASVICNSTSKQAMKDFLQTLPADLQILNSALEEIINFDFAKSMCLIGAGEPTVVVNGSGRGGRNQQLALALSVQLNKLNIKSADISFLSAGTDGIDGPTDAAGAIGTSDLVNNSLRQNIKPQDYLDNNDSYGFYTNYCSGNHLIKIGHTGTNVMDIHIIIIKPVT